MTKLKLRHIGLISIMLVNLLIFILASNGFFHILFLRFSYFPLFILDAFTAAFFIKNSYLKYIVAVIVLAIGSAHFLLFKLVTLDSMFSEYTEKYIISRNTGFGEQQYTYAVFKKEALGFAMRTNDKLVVTIRQYDERKSITVEKNGEIILSKKQIVAPQTNPIELLTYIYPEMIEKKGQ